MTENATRPGTLQLPVHDDPLVSLKEAHRRGFPHPNTLRRYIHEGKIPGQRVGKQFMIRESHLGLLLRPIERQADTDADTLPEHVVRSSFEDLALLTSTLVTAWPRLDSERRDELRQLLAV